MTKLDTILTEIPTIEDSYKLVQDKFDEYMKNKLTWIHIIKE